MAGSGGSKRGEAHLTSAAKPGFSNSVVDDWNMYASSAAQAMHIGVDPLNSVAGIVLSSSNVTVNKALQLLGDVAATTASVTASNVNAQSVYAPTVNASNVTASNASIAQTLSVPYAAITTLSNNSLAASNAVVASSLTAYNLINSNAAITTLSNNTLATSNVTVSSNLTAPLATVTTLSNTTLNTAVAVASASITAPLATLTTLSNNTLATSNVSIAQALTAPFATMVTLSNNTLAASNATVASMLSACNLINNNAAILTLSNNTLATSNVSIAQTLTAPLATVLTLSNNTLFTSNVTVASNITVASRVGINTTAPTSALDVRGQLTLCNDFNWTTGGLRFRDTVGAVDAGIVQGTNGQMIFRPPSGANGSNGYAWTGAGGTPNLMTLTNAGTLSMNTLAASNATVPGTLTACNYVGSNATVTTLSNSALAASNATVISTLTACNYLGSNAAIITLSNSALSASNAIVASTLTACNFVSSNAAISNAAISNATITTLSNQTISASNVTLTNNLTTPLAFISTLSNNGLAASNVNVSSNLTAPLATIATLSNSVLATSNVVVGSNLVTPLAIITMLSNQTLATSNVTVSSNLAASLATITTLSNTTFSTSNITFATSLTGSLATVTTFNNSTLASSNMMGINVTASNLTVVGSSTPSREYPPAALTSDSYTLTGQAYANGLYVSSTPNGGGSNVCNIFDKDLTTQYASAYGFNNNVWTSTSVTVNSTAYPGIALRVAMPAVMALKSFALTRTNTNTAPRDFYVFGSSDGSTWTQLFSTTGEVWAVNTNTYTVNAVNAFNYYMLVITAIAATTGNYLFRLNEWQLYGTEGTLATISTLNNNILASSNVTITSTLTACNITASNLTVPNITASNATASNLTASNLSASNVTASNVTASNVTASNVTASNVTASNVTASNVTVSTITNNTLSASNATIAGAATIGTSAFNSVPLVVNTSNAVLANLYRPTISNNQNIQMYFGKSATTNNAAYFTYVHSGGDGAANNFIQMGIFGAPGALALNGSGNVTANSLTVSTTASVTTSLTTPLVIATTSSNSTLAASNITASNITASNITASNLMANTTSNATLAASNITAVQSISTPLLAATTSSNNTLAASNITASNVVASNLTVNGPVTISGDLTVNGTTTTINANNLNITDNIVVVNNGQTNPPPSTLQSGLEVNRGGQLSNAQLLYTESNRLWKVGTAGGTLNTLATRLEQPQDRSIAFYDASTCNYLHTSNLVWSAAGQLGIGTGTPAYTLDVSAGTLGAATISNQTLAASNATVLTTMAACNLTSSNATINTMSNTQMTATNAVVSGTLDLGPTGTNTTAGAISGQIRLGFRGGLEDSSDYAQILTQNLGSSATELMIFQGNDPPDRIRLRSGTIMFDTFPGFGATYNSSTNIRMTINSNGNVGIGTQTPASLLDVAGTANFATSVTTPAATVTAVTASNVSTSNAAVGTLSNSTLAASNATIQSTLTACNITASNVTVSTLLAPSLTASNLAASNATIIGQMGIGIGTATPAYTVDVSAGSLGAATICNQTLVASNATVQLTLTASNVLASNATVTGVLRAGAAGTATSLLLGNSTDTGTQGRFLSALDSTMAINDVRYITFGKSNSASNQAELTYVHQGDGAGSNKLQLGFANQSLGTRLTVLANGNVGVGMSNPNAPLQFSNVIVNRKIVMFDVNNNDHQFYGMGIGSFQNRYQVESSVANHVFYAGSSSTASTELMRITGTGLVGIGTNNPGTTLDVVGTMRASSAVTVGGTFTASNTIIVGQGNNAGATSTYLQLYGSNSETRIYSHSDGRTYLQHSNDLFIGGISQTAIPRLLVQASTSNVGIGTASPAYKLDVSGTIRANITGTPGLQIGTSTDTQSTLFVSAQDSGMAAGSQRYIQFGHSSTNSNNAQISYYHTGSGSGSNALRLGFWGNATDKVALLANGNVGMGTITPQALLHLSDDYFMQANANTWNSNITAPGLYMRYATNGTCNAAYIQSVTRSNLTWQNLNLEGSNLYFNTVATVSASASNRMTISAAGNIGIGTSNPLSRLDVNGSDTTANGTGAAISLQNTASTTSNEWYMRPGGPGNATPDGGFSIGDCNALRLVLDSNGNLRAASCNTQLGPVAASSLQGSLLQVADSNSSSIVQLQLLNNQVAGGRAGLNLGNSAGSTFITHDTNGNFVTYGTPGTATYITNKGFLWQDASTGTITTRLSLTSNGSLGIGNTSPAYTLDVAGSINFTGTLYQNGAAFSGGGGGTSTTLTASNTNTSNLYVQNNAGVGTATPAYKLDVAGTIRASVTGMPALQIGTSTDTTSTILLSAQDSNMAANTQRSIQLGNSSNGNSALLSYYHYANNAIGNSLRIGFNNGNTIMYIFNGGYVGIGVEPSNPYYRLDVAGTIRANNTSGQASLQLGTSTDTTSTLLMSAQDSNMAVGTQRSIQLGFNSTNSNSALVSYYHTGSGSSSNQLRLGVTGANSNAMTILANGNIGISTATPSYPLDVHGSIRASTVYADNGVYANNGVPTTGMTQSQFPSSPFQAQGFGPGITFSAISTYNYANAGGLVYHMVFYVNNGSATQSVGSITTTTSTQYNTTSDYRIKENVVALSNALDRVSLLRPIRYNFKADPGGTVDGFLAHEVQLVVPEAVTGKKDAVDENGGMLLQQVDHSKLVALLTAAVQELKAGLAAQQDEINALKQQLQQSQTSQTQTQPA